MRDVSSKYNTLRVAKATARLKVTASTIAAIESRNLPKAHPLEVAKVAGIQAAKNTSLLIPYCHQVPLDFVDVAITLDSSTIVVNSEVKAIWKTGVEMEALAAVFASALTLYDMLKPIDEEMEIVSIKLIEKTGGKSSMRETGEGLTAGVLVVSDSVATGAREDRSGRIAVERLKKFGIQVAAYNVLPDDCGSIERELTELADKQRVDLIVTTGGTGAGPRDITPEATQGVIERRLDGAEEMVRRFGQDRMHTAMLTRGIIGLRGKTLIINLPGSAGGVEDGFNALFPAILHTFKMVRGEGH